MAMTVIIILIVITIGSVPEIRCTLKAESLVKRNASCATHLAGRSDISPFQLNQQSSQATSYIPNTPKKEGLKRFQRALRMFPAVFHLVAVPCTPRLGADAGLGWPAVRRKPRDSCVDLKECGRGSKQRTPEGSVKSIII